MKKPPFFQHLFFIVTTIVLINTTSNAQITGNSGPASVAPATPTIVDATITVGGSADLTDATVQIIANFYNGDILSFDAGVASSFGISGNYVTTDVSGILTFTGTTSPANWQEIFRTVTYENGSASCGPSSRTINFLQGNLLYNSYNGHYYEFVNENLNWKEAKAAAALRSFNGMQGYLATSTSAGENNFIWKLMAADAWVGGTYDYEEINAATGTTTFADQNSANGNVYWVTGPEKGTFVSSGIDVPVSQNGQYMNWTPGEPNNWFNTDEFYVQLYSGNDGLWNDLPLSSTLPYLVEYGGMPNDAPQNNTFATSLTLTSTVGGDITGGDVSVCAGSNSTTLTTTADVPGVTIVRWESSIDNFLTPGTVINNTTNTLTVDNLTETTYFRSIANGNSCAEAPSSSTKITVGNSVAGTLSATYTTICNNSGAELALFGNNGNIVKWQTSPDNSSWSDIAITTPTYTTTPLTTGDYFFRTEIQNASCPTSVFSNAVQITVTAGAASIGGTLSGAENACGIVNTGLLTVSGYTGSIIKWQSSSDNGIIWTDIANTNDTYNFNNITTTTKYRAVVQNGSCNAANSSVITVVYSAISNTWNGATSTDFGDATNWTCAVPGAGTNIVISAAAPNMPILDQDRNIGNITFENNTNININGHAFTVDGIVTGTNSGNFIGSAISSLIFTGQGDAGTIYFDQSNPNNVLTALTINKSEAVIPTPPSSPVCIPDVPYGYNNMGITNVTLGSINNTTVSQDGYTNYFPLHKTEVDPSTDYTVSVTTDPSYFGDEGIRIWIDWNNNGTFGDQPGELITDIGGSTPGTYDFNFTTPVIGGDITGGSKTMRVMVEDYWNMFFDSYIDACHAYNGEFEDYKINLSPLPLTKGQVTLGNDLQINNAVNFNNGIINTGSNILSLSENSFVTGVRNESHVNGNVRKIGNTAFTFPVGDDTYYAPISMSAPADIADHFTASYTKADPLPVYNNTSYGNDIISISSNEYWILNRTNGNSDVNVTLSWDAARSSAIPNIGQLRVSRWDGSMWTNAGNANLTTGNLTAGTVTSNTVTDFSPFTLGIGSSILPVNLLNFTAARNNKEVNLNWQTSAEINSRRFDIERSGNNNIWVKIGEVQGQGNSNRVSDYSFADASPLSGNNYYRLRIVDIDGKFVYSQVRLVNFTFVQSSSVYPNPFTGDITIDGGNKMIGSLFVIDMNGKVVYRSTIKKTRETINLSQLAAGQYTILDNDNYFKVIKMR